MYHPVGQGVAAAGASFLLTSVVLAEGHLEGVHVHEYKTPLFSDVSFPAISRLEKKYQSHTTYAAGSQTTNRQFSSLPLLNPVCIGDCLFPMPELKVFRLVVE